MTPWKMGLLVIAGMLGVAVIVALVGTGSGNAPVTNAPAESLITWVDFKTGSAMAREENRPMMMDFATDWCGWCKKLDAEVYSTAEVAELAKSFVCVRIDGDKETELTAKFKVEGYPTIVFTNSKGEEKARIPGFAPAGDFAREMKGALAKVR